MDQFKFTLVAVVLMVMMLLGLLLHTSAETRKAYYACLQLVEKVIQEQNNSDGSTRIVSLPYCRL